MTQGTFDEYVGETRDRDPLKYMMRNGQKNDDEARTLLRPAHLTHPLLRSDQVGQYHVQVSHL